MASDFCTIFSFVSLHLQKDYITYIRISQGSF